MARCTVARPLGLVIPRFDSDLDHFLVPQAIAAVERVEAVQHTVQRERVADHIAVGIFVFLQYTQPAHEVFVCAGPDRLKSRIFLRISNWLILISMEPISTKWPTSTNTPFIVSRIPSPPAWRGGIRSIRIRRRRPASEGVCQSTCSVRSCDDFHLFNVDRHIGAEPLSQLQPRRPGRPP